MYRREEAIGWEQPEDLARDIIWRGLFRDGESVEVERGWWTMSGPAPGTPYYRAVRESDRIAGEWTRSVDEALEALEVALP